MLIPEIWLIIISFSSLIDVWNFRCVYSKFLEIIQSGKWFDELFKFLNWKFEALSQSVKYFYKVLIPPSHNFIFSIFEKRVNKIKFAILPFCTKVKFKILPFCIFAICSIVLVALNLLKNVYGALDFVLIMTK